MTCTNTNHPVGQKSHAWGHLIPLVNDHSHPSLNCTLKLSENAITIGRKKDNTFQLHSFQLSNHHCKIERSADGISVIFTDTSRNGTWINKKPIKGRNVLIVEDTEILFVPQSRKRNRKRIGYLFRSLSSNAYQSKLEEEYCLMKSLGSGGFASVKLCQHKITGMKYAVKSIDRQSWQHLKYNTSRTITLLDEVNIMHNLKHKNIIRVHKYFEEQNCIHIIIDYCMGGDMLDYIQKNGKYSDGKACVLFQQLIDGLEYLHMCNIAHRDLKPDNILLMDKNSDWVKISDFGISRQCTNSSLCKTVIGTPLYQAPEVNEQKVVDKEKTGYDGKLCDLWSLGVILYIMIMAAPPAAKAETIREMIAGYDRLNWYGLSVDANAKQLIMDLMKMNPNERITIPEMRNHSWIKQQKMEVHNLNWESCNMDIEDSKSNINFNDPVTKSISLSSRNSEGTENDISFSSSNAGSLLCKRKDNVVDSEWGTPVGKRRKTE